MLTTFVISTLLTTTEPNYTPPPVVPQATHQVIKKPKPKHKKVTWRDNPFHCNRKKQYIAAERPFYCIDKPSTRIAKTPATPPRISSDNLYDLYSCTWWVKYNRPDIPNSWGNATDWFYNAQQQGYSTGTVPRAGAVGWRYSHVVYVFSVHGDTITIGDGNYDYNGSYRVREASASEFQYIY